jgi:dihydrofolate synthase/folylpolyglutamate synthase
MTPPSYRALDAQVLSDWLHEQGAQAEAAESVADGVARALSLASEDDVICAWGSLYSTGEVRHCLGLC